MSPVFGHGALRLYLLKLLDEQPRHGYDLMQELEARFQGLYTPSAGTIYPRLSRLQSDGLVEPAEDGSGARKTYRLTDAGREELAARAEELADLETTVLGSARNLAREIKAEVRASTRDLREELKNAVRDVRREEKARRHDTSPATKAVLGAFAVELGARLGPLDPPRLATLGALLREAGDRIVRELA